MDPCSKDKEIAVVQQQIFTFNDNINDIKKDMQEMSRKLNTIHDTLIKGDGKIHVLNKEVFDNGKPGLGTRIDKLKEQIDYWKGAIIIMSFGIPLIVSLLVAWFT